MTPRLTYGAALLATLVLVRPLRAQLQPVDTAKWSLLVVDSTSAIWLDRRPPVASNGNKLAWILIQFRVGAELAVPGDTTRAARLLNRWEYDCTLRRTLLLDAVYYARNGQQSSQTTFDRDKGTWVDIIPGSKGEQILDAICRRP